jgi:hypothetical protein
MGIPPLVSQSRTGKGAPMLAVSKAIPARVVVENVMSSGRTHAVDAKKYSAMKDALVRALPKRAPGLTGLQMSAAVLLHLPETEFPGGAKAGWWLKCVQLDLEAKGIVARETSKPLRWHLVKKSGDQK